eukprot:358893-Chlamydomonas_euryale.AAC.8
MAALPEWPECVREFHHAGGRWWGKCMSTWGRRQFGRATAAGLARAAGSGATRRHVTSALASPLAAAAPAAAEAHGGTSAAGVLHGGGGDAVVSGAAGSGGFSTPGALPSGVGDGGAGCGAYVAGHADDMEVASQWGAFSMAWDALVRLQ